MHILSAQLVSALIQQVPNSLLISLFLAPPKITFSPFLHSNMLSVEANRKASLECVVDADIYPPVTSITGTSIIHSVYNYMMCIHVVSMPATRPSLNVTDYCLSSVLYQTENASRHDSNQYNCTVTSDGIATTRSVQLIVQGMAATLLTVLAGTQDCSVSEPSAEEIRDPDYLRFSVSRTLLPCPFEQLVS